MQPQVRSLGRAERTLAALFRLRLGELCDRGRRERLTARVATKEIAPTLIIVVIVVVIVVVPRSASSSSSSPPSASP